MIAIDGRVIDVWGMGCCHKDGIVTDAWGVQ